MPFLPDPPRHGSAMPTRVLRSIVAAIFFTAHFRFTNVHHFKHELRLVRGIVTPATTRVRRLVGGRVENSTM